jgi:hypothetical protein
MNERTCSHLHGSRILQNWEWRCSLFPEGFVGSVGAPFDNTELAIPVNVEDTSESITGCNFQAELHLILSPHGTKYTPREHWHNIDPGRNSALICTAQVV